VKITNRIISILLILLMLLSNGAVFAAESESYEAGYDEGYDYGLDESGSGLSASRAYRDFEGSRTYDNIKDDIDDFSVSDFRDGFYDGYDDGYRLEDEVDEEIDYAETLGKLLGEIYGAKDFHNGKKADWKKSLPSSREVRNMYDLDKQNSSYRSAFISTFNKFFQEGYAEAYDMAMFEPAKVTMEQGISDGETTGELVGAAFGVKDFYEGRDSDFERDMPTDDQIRAQYSLAYDYDDYEDGFTAGFKRAYEEGYNAAYREANTNQTYAKVTSNVVPISGAETLTADGRFAVKVLPGTYYRDVNLTITTSYDVANIAYGSFIKASDSYTVQISNSGSADDSKTVELSFEYYGDKYLGGIYRQDGSKWSYIPTVIKDNKMSAQINPNSLHTQGTTFSAFVDKNVSALRDIRGHWAGNEIDAYARRGIVSGYGDNTFKPDNNISRAEFLMLLSRVYNWNVSWYYGTVTGFNDADKFGIYTDVISHASRNGYIYGYPDGSFKPGNPISYSEVETIMRRVVSYSNYRWSNTANDMLYDKQERSDSFSSMNNSITRAEVVYMLYSLTE
jgi:hypothetical protein